MPHPHQISAGIFAGPHQISDRLDLTLGHRHFGDLTQTQQPGQMRGIAGSGLDPIPGRALQLRRRGNQALHPGRGDRPRQSEPGRARFVGRPHRRAQLAQPTQELAVVRTQPCPSDLACFLLDAMRDNRKRMHVQPDTRTLNNHRRPPDLQMWLYQRVSSAIEITAERRAWRSCSSKEYSEFIGDVDMIGEPPAIRDAPNFCQSSPAIPVNLPCTSTSGVRRQA